MWFNYKHNLPPSCLHHFLSVLLLFSHPVVSHSLRPHGLQHTRPPCPSPSPEVCSSSCLLHLWCYPAISSSDTLFSFCSQSFLASGTFPVSQLFTSDNQNTGVSASVLPMSTQDWFPLRLTGLISLLSKSLSGVFSSTTARRHRFFGAPPSLQSALTTLHGHWEDHSIDCMELRWQSNVSAFQHTCLGLP